MKDFTPAERRVARTLLAGYPALGLGSAAELAGEASASSATVIRLVQKLGYEGFPDFHGSLREELSSRRAGPIDLLDRTGDVNGVGTLATLSSALADRVASIAKTVPQTEFDAAVALLADPKRQIHLLGGRVSHNAAELFGGYLTRLRPNVSVIPRDSARQVGTLVEASRRSVLVAFDFRRYELSTVEVTRLMAKRGAKIIVVTDLLMSPAASVATIVLPLRIDVPSPFDTFVTGTALVECLSLAVMKALGSEGVNRMREWDAVAAHELVQE